MKDNENIKLGQFKIDKFEAFQQNVNNFQIIENKDKNIIELKSSEILIPQKLTTNIATETIKLIKYKNNNYQKLSSPSSSFAYIESDINDKTMKTFLKSNFKYKRREINENEFHENYKGQKEEKKDDDDCNKKEIDFKNDDKTITSGTKRNIFNYYHHNYLLLLITMISEFIKCIKKICQYTRYAKILNNNCPIGYIMIVIAFVSIGFTEMTEGKCLI